MIGSERPPSVVMLFNVVVAASRVSKANESEVVDHKLVIYVPFKLIAFVESSGNVVKLEYEIEDINAQHSS